MADVSDQSVTEDGGSPDSSPIALGHLRREWQGCLLFLEERSPASALISPLLWTNTSARARRPGECRIAPRKQSSGCPQPTRLNLIQCE
jgi:hypothetical protein